MNTAIFSFENRQLVNTKFIWDQSIQDEFDNYLPKSKKGKIRPWYFS